MRNKIFKIYALVLVAQIFLYACCDNNFNIFVKSFEFSAQDEADEDATSVSNADFFLQFEPTYQVDVAALLSKNSSLINTAYAAIDCFDEYTVIKYVENIEVTSDVPLFDIPAGASLNDRILVTYRFNAENLFTTNDMILRLNGGPADSNYSLRFDTEIPAETTATFTFTITFENEEQLVITTAAVTFE
ncbi:hypothetical protein [Kordia sp.]|uniref:hypothetical protein n=1 Tax=Kordia sp. TaxID=1965332 RepID=UPI003D27B4CC